MARLLESHFLPKLQIPVFAKLVSEKGDTYGSPVRAVIN